MGSEHGGLSAEAFALADEYISIPMYGFTESFNISVAIAILLYALIHSLHQSKLHWQLCNEDNIKLEYVWTLKSTGCTEHLWKKYQAVKK